MANRLTRGDKEKWIAEKSRHVRRPPVKIPVADTNALIEENRLTLIGRVTNPAVQKTRALVDFFIQHWHVSGQITGKALGPSLFQFKFENERDLQLILEKGPYHFKRWMLILQRWEPVVSDNFPALIPFWITVHGIPLHYWSEVTLETIGKELGPVEDFDVDQARVRVSINGLQPLEMKLEINVAGEIKQVELEYENLQKHCFYCLSLTHEGDDCPNRSRNGRETHMGISQNRTLDRLEADRRRKEVRKGARNLSGPKEQSPAYPHSVRPKEHYEPSRRCDLSRKYDYGVRREPYRRGMSPNVRDRERQGRPSARERLTFTRDSETASHRGHLSNSFTSAQRTEWRPVSEGAKTLDRSAHSAHSQMSHTPSPRPQRENISSQAGTTDARQNSGNGTPSAERRSALARLSLPVERVPLLQDGVANTASGRLQEVQIQYLEENLNLLTSGGSNKASTSKTPRTGTSATQGGITDRSPIRTLSEDRVHVSLRLGPVYEPYSDPRAAEQETSLSEDFPLLARTTDKGKASLPAGTRKRVARSSTQGISLKKRRVTKGNSPKRRTPPATPSAGQATATQGTTTRAQPRTTAFPSSRKKGADFRSGPNPLP